jgi:hypothetical protein
MGTFVKFGIGMTWVTLAASGALFAQAGKPVKPQNNTAVLDARQIIGLSVVATERSWEARDRYTYTERDDDRRLDSLGHVKSQDVDVTKVIMVNGAHFDQLTEHNGQAPCADDQRKRDAAINTLRNESPAERTARSDKDRDNRAFLRDVIQAFDFRLVGEETVEGRAAYVVEATPHPGYSAHGKYGRFLSKVQGKLWIDKQDYGWIKVDGQVTQAFQMGLFVARVQRGSHIILEQTAVGDAVWMPRRMEIRASARLFFVKSFDLDRIYTYSDYLPAPDASYVAIK